MEGMLKTQNFFRDLIKIFLLFHIPKKLQQKSNIHTLFWLWGCIGNLVLFVGFLFGMERVTRFLYDLTYHDPLAPADVWHIFWNFIEVFFCYIYLSYFCAIIISVCNKIAKEAEQKNYFILIIYGLLTGIAALLGLSAVGILFTLVSYHLI